MVCGCQGCNAQRETTLMFSLNWPNIECLKVQEMSVSYWALKYGNCTSSCANQQWGSKRPALIYNFTVEFHTWSSTLQLHGRVHTTSKLLKLAWWYYLIFIQLDTAQLCKQAGETIFAFLIFVKSIVLLSRLVFCVILRTPCLWCQKDTLITTNRVYKL